MVPGLMPSSAINMPTNLKLSGLKAPTGLVGGSVKLVDK